MKKFYSVLALAFVITFATSARELATTKVLPFGPDQKEFKMPMKSSKAHLLADELVVLPESAVVEDGWLLDGTYINNGNGYTNTNEISVAFDGNDIYVKGMIFLCPDAWIKGTAEGELATFANGQYCGMYGEDPIYACGTDDGDDFADIIFEYDAAGKKLTLSNYYLENVSLEDMSFWFYSYNITIYKPISVPTDFAVNPAKDSAELSWVQPEGDASLWDVRYRKTVPEDVLNRTYDFEDGAQLNDFVIIDADGDGYSWEFSNVKQSAHSGAGIAHSASYINGVGALTPDNWLISPVVTLGGKLSFWYRGQDNSYSAEVFKVYVIPGEEANIDKAQALSADITSTNEYAEYSYDLAEYSGKGRIAIRHYNVTDMFWLNVDDFSLTVPNGQDANPWNIVEDVTVNPFNLIGLEEDTEYEAGVRAKAGEEVTDWCPTIKFTTTDSGVDGIAADKKADNVWYNILGVRLNGQPTSAGIYINNGKKIVVR